MGNVFQTEAVLHRRFDLKGSTHGRTAGARAADPAAILKARRWRSCWYHIMLEVRIQANGVCRKLLHVLVPVHAWPERRAL